MNKLERFLGVVKEYGNSVDALVANAQVVSDQRSEIEKLGVELGFKVTAVREMLPKAVLRVASASQDGEAAEEAQPAQTLLDQFAPVAPAYDFAVETAELAERIAKAGE